MVWGLVTSLGSYSILVTGALILISVLYAKSGAQIIETRKNGNESNENKIKTEQLTHVELFRLVNVQQWKSWALNCLK